MPYAPAVVWGSSGASSGHQPWGRPGASARLADVGGVDLRVIGERRRLVVLVPFELALGLALVVESLVLHVDLLPEAAVVGGLGGVTAALFVVSRARARRMLARLSGTGAPGVVVPSIGAVPVPFSDRGQPVVGAERLVAPSQRRSKAV